MNYYVGESSIDSGTVTERLDELQEKRDELSFIVFRVRSDETLGTFGSEPEAKQYVDEQDYDPERVRVRMTSAGLDGDEKEELEELESIDAEGRSSFTDWDYGITVQRDDDISIDDYARDYIKENYSDREGLLDLLNGYINYENLGESLLEDRETADFRAPGDTYSTTYIYL